MIYLDTHAAIWLQNGDADWMSPLAQKVLEEETDVRLSPIVVLEFQILSESGRLKMKTATVLANLVFSVGAYVCALPFELVVRKAFEITWANDPMDRLIVAHALANDAPLLTRDRLILQRYARAFC